MITIFCIIAYFAILTNALPWINTANAELSEGSIDDVIPVLPGISIEIDPGSAFTIGIETNPDAVDATISEIIVGPTGFGTNFGEVPSAVGSPITSSPAVITGPAVVTGTVSTSTDTPIATTSPVATTIGILIPTTSSPINSNPATLSPVAVATGSVAANSVNDNDGIGAGTDTYTLHTGDGSPGSGYPSIKDWVSFGDMFGNSIILMNQSCGNNHEGANDSPDEIGRIRNAVENVAQATQVDHRFILAIIMQESGGCVRVKSTPSPDRTVNNPGLMQDHNGKFNCVGVDDCSQDQITGMVLEGTGGTSSGPGLAGILNDVQSTFGVTDAQAFYFAARTYNSGQVADRTNLGSASGATACYTSDVANRLTGWTLAKSQCSHDNALG